MQRICILDEEKSCTECGQCDICDLDPSKICDNCCKCIETGDYAEIGIDGVFEDADEHSEWDEPEREIDE